MSAIVRAITEELKSTMPQASIFWHSATLETGLDLKFIVLQEVVRENFVFLDNKSPELFLTVYYLTPSRLALFAEDWATKLSQGLGDWIYDVDVLQDRLGGSRVLLDAINVELNLMPLPDKRTAKELEIVLQKLQQELGGIPPYLNHFVYRFLLNSLLAKREGNPQSLFRSLDLQNHLPKNHSQDLNNLLRYLPARFDNALRPEAPPP